MTVVVAEGFGMIVKMLEGPAILTRFLLVLQSQLSPSQQYVPLLAEHCVTKLPPC